MLTRLASRGSKNVNSDSGAKRRLDNYSSLGLGANEMAGPDLKTGEQLETVPDLPSEILPKTTLHARPPMGET